MRGEDRAGPRTCRSAWAREVADALATLDTTQQRAITLVYCHGLAQFEAAASMSMPATAVATAVANGLRVLAQRLDPSWPR